MHMYIRKLFIRGAYSKTLQRGALLALLLWGWAGFKHWEPIICPVVKDFTIEHVKNIDGSTMIGGSMIKTRDCEFVEVVAYSNNYLLDVEFRDTQYVVSRVEGYQLWGYWAITPPVSTLTLYAHHECATGRVTTVLFDGLIVKGDAQ